LPRHLLLDGPAIGKHTLKWIGVLAYCFELIAAEKEDFFGRMTKIVADMALPAFGGLSPEDGDTPWDWTFQRRAPFEPGPGQGRIGAG
jgi:hypothetical protein